MGLDFTELKNPFLQPKLCFIIKNSGVKLQVKIGDLWFFHLMFFTAFGNTKVQMRFSQKMMKIGAQATHPQAINSSNSFVQA